ncbi:MAG: hypothetical protein JNJ77_12280 [Planctomycetia bacterium]|nr:hypothetical protein [Planctomycetia bacterium]
MRTHFICLAVLASTLSGCMVTEPMTSEEMLKYSGPNAEQFKKDEPVTVKQPKPETCLEAGKMYETLAKSATDVTEQRDKSWRAKQAYTQALRLKPGWPAAIAGLARVEEFEGNAQSASQHFSQAMQNVTGKDSTDAAACHEAGLFFARVKQFDLSLNAMKRAAELDPNNRTYAMNYGFTLARAGRYEEGYQYFSKIMNPSEAALQMAQMAKHVGDSERSRQYAGFALQQNPTNTQAQQFMAQLDQPANIQQIQQQGQ